MKRLKTSYDIEKIPHSEYPRPQLVRDSYMCLNGEWDFAKVGKTSNANKFSQKILVPFSPETINSGIKEGFLLSRDEKNVYRKEFIIDGDFNVGRIILHFGAVDQYCEVYLNGDKVGSHKGGYTSFSFDISDYVIVGLNKLTVECIDDTEYSSGARGKQSSKPGGIWYTAQSGIWQTVWLESVPDEYIKELKITPNTQTSEVNVYIECNGEKTVNVFDGEEKILSKVTSDNRVVLKYDFERWSPVSPKLYTLVITTESGDKVTSYFGMRSFGIGKDEKGIPRLLMNGEVYFFNGILDQGYWSDGLLTPPSDKAMLDELKMLKNMGFNMIRKHIKIEPMRWYYYCDLLGITVWQDFVNGGGEYRFSHIAALPFLGIKHKDDDYKYFSRENKAGREEFIDSVHETVNALYNCPCIAAWVPFNEGWGQFDSERITSLVKKLDDTRIIDSVSGWHDQGAGKTELCSLHTYYTPLKVPKDTRPVVLSEFGGYSLKIEGHVFDDKKEFGYKKFKNDRELFSALEELYIKKLLPLIEKGLCASVYTQVSDVEEEINGLITYDRKHLKVSVGAMKKINDIIKSEAEKIKVEKISIM